MATRTGTLGTITQRGRKQNGQILHIDHSGSHEKVADALLDQLRRLNKTTQETDQ